MRALWKWTKWTKWQIGIVLAIALFYLFQQVKGSPEFLAAVKKASQAKEEPAVAAIPDRRSEPLLEPPGQGRGRHGRSSDFGDKRSQPQAQERTQPQSQTSPQSSQAQPRTHTRSTAS